MRERVILSTADNAAIDREARANAADNTTRARDEGFNVGVCFPAGHEKFDLDLFIAGADAVVEGFMMGAMSSEMSVIRYSSSASPTANADT